MSSLAGEIFETQGVFVKFEKIKMIGMKILLDIKDDKAAFIMELLNNFKFVKAKPLTPYKAEVLEGLKDAVDQVNRAKRGEIKLKSIHQLLNEL